jgi:hypothetical protein
MPDNTPDEEEEETMEEDLYARSTNLTRVIENGEEYEAD